ncbi:MAG: hypothetical protein GXX90_07310 [Microbacteriaceae bacterium]|nr:hypothetical protein [Microbacteriaceae bacterium]
MTTTAPEARRRLPWWRRLLPLPAVVFAGAFGFTYSPLGAAFSGGGFVPGAIVLELLLAFALGTTATVLLAWRAAHPRTVLGIVAMLAVIAPITPMPVLVALPGFIDRLGRLDRRGAVELAAGIGAAAVVGAIAAFRDATAPTAAASLTQALLREAPAGFDAHYAVPLWVSIASVAVPLAVAVAIGAMRRTVRLGRGAEARTLELDDELARRAEREAISREVHDALGHRLSLLSLQAGALEARAAADPVFAEQVAQLRENAAQSMGDLRALLEQLDRRPVAMPVAELRRVLDGAAGPYDAIEVALDPVALADPELGRAVVRIVQELLTNARKHAHGSALRLHVAGAPGEGVRIRCANWIAPGLAGGGSGGRGLAGIAERVRLLGGTSEAGCVGNEFRVRVDLPWRRIASSE